MARSRQKEFWIYTAILTVSMTVAALSGALLVAQVSIGPSAGCLEENVAPLVPLGHAGDESIMASMLPTLTNLFVEANKQTLTGRLSCADSRPAFYNCGHTKQSVWGCKPDCFMERDGSQYVLESLCRSYSVTGDSTQIRRFLANRVTITGELKGDTIKVVSITKASKKERQSRFSSEDGTP